jgi:hypothetical protein
MRRWCTWFQRWGALWIWVFFSWGETEWLIRLLVGWDWVHLVLRPLFGLLYQLQMIDVDDCGAIGGMQIVRGNRSIQRKPASVPLCPPQIPHDLNRTRTRATAVGGLQLTTWAMTRPNLGVRRYVHRLIHVETGHPASLRHDGGFQLMGVVMKSQRPTKILPLDAGQPQGDNSSMWRLEGAKS